VRTTIGALALAVYTSQIPPDTRSLQPEVGRPGKDVKWVPTAQTLVDTMLDLAKVTAEDVVIDLGSGDGRAVITAAKRGARALGIEYEPDLVELSRQAAASAGVSDRTTFMKADLFDVDLSPATVITMFLLPELNLKLRPKILDLRPGTRIVSNTFTMGDWNADQTVRVGGGCVDWCTALLWIVPAKVAGTWKLPDGELTLLQAFQVVGGSWAGDTGGLITNGRVVGDRITFDVGVAQFVGRVDGDVIEGTLTTNGSTTRVRSTRGDTR
jgi:SAM-dependent methyltransferase